MKTVTNILCRLSCSVLSLAFASTAAAQEGPSSFTSMEGLSGGVEVLTLEELDSFAGGTGVTNAVVTDQMLAALNAGNSVRGDVVGSGALNIGSNAFSGYSGIGNFVMNTGHNNNLQSSMNVSILLAPPSN